MGTFSDWGNLVLSGGAMALNAIAQNNAYNQNRQALFDQFNYNMNLSKYAYDRDIDMWNRQNEYNSPTNQMQRLKDAGLNPNLMYGQGDTGNAGTPPSFNPPTMGAYTGVGDYGVGQSMQYLLTALNTFADIDKKDAETANIRQNLQNLQTDNEYKKLQVSYQGLVNSRTEVERDYWRTQIETALANTDSSTQRNLAETQLTGHTIERYALMTPILKATTETELAQKLYDLNNISPAKLKNIQADTAYKNLVSKLTSIKTSLYENEKAFSDARLPYKELNAYNEAIIGDIKKDIAIAEKEIKRIESTYNIKLGSGLQGLIESAGIFGSEFIKSLFK